MNCIVNLAAVASGDIGISYCQEVSTAGRKHRHSASVNTGWGLKQAKMKEVLQHDRTGKKIYGDCHECK